MADFTREQIEEIIENLRDASVRAYWIPTTSDEFCKGEQSGLLRAVEMLLELLREPKSQIERHKMDINQLHQTRYQLLETAYTLQQQAAQLQQQLADNAALQRNLDAQLQEVTGQIKQAMQTPAPAPAPDTVEIDSVDLGDRTRMVGNTLHCDKCGSFQESSTPLGISDVTRFILNHACKENSTATVMGEILPDTDGNVRIEI